MMKDKKILVTGGLGFIGTRLVNRLAIDNTVVVYDNLLAGDHRNREHRSIHPSVKVVIAPASSIVSGNDRGFDYIFHLGEYSRVENSFNNIDGVYENVKGFHDVLSFALLDNAKLIYSGSSTKFHKSQKDYVVSPYEMSKTTNTEYLKQFAEWTGLNYATVYFYNVYGPGENETGDFATLIGRFKRLSELNETLSITLPGTQLRNFTHVDDIVDGLILVAEHGVGEDFGIGHDDAYSVIDVAKMFNPSMDRVRYTEKRDGNRRDSYLITSNTKALGWKASRTLPEYIQAVNTAINTPKELQCSQSESIIR